MLDVEEKNSKKLYFGFRTTRWIAVYFVDSKWFFILTLLEFLPEVVLLESFYGVYVAALTQYVIHVLDGHRRKEASSFHSAGEDLL